MLKRGEMFQAPTCTTETECTKKFFLFLAAGNKRNCSAGFSMHEICVRAKYMAALYTNLYIYVYRRILVWLYGVYYYTHV